MNQHAKPVATDKTTLTAYKMLIGDAWVDAADGDRFESLNPFLGKPWATMPRAKATDARKAIDAAQAAFNGPWHRMTPTQRGALMRKLADLVAAEAERLAAVEVRDNGKLMAEMHGQLKYIPQFYTYFAGLADKLQGAVIPTDKAEIFNFTRREPLGVCVAITAWNSPLLLTAYKLAPGLAAGNTFVLKPSEHASASTIEFVKLFEKAGFPPGVVNVVTGFGPEIGEALVLDPRVAKVSFTGSEGTGQRIYEMAAKGLKKVTLELGGKSPNIVFDDANLDNAANGVVSGIFAAAGQTCIAGSRLLVQDTIYDKFLDKLAAIAKRARMGDPMDPATQIGPIANPPQFEKIKSYLDVAKGEGARVLAGGSVATRPECGTGQFIEPTIFADVNNNMRIAREEVFGPVAAAIRFKDIDEAIAIANDSPYGLAAGVWTENMRRALIMSERLEAGTVWVNTYRAVSFTSPFGGYKRSGLGRENGMEAVDAYLQTKSVWLSMATEVPNPFVMR
jgi:(Z)-2-((N-methylformamido)methylene)-5-hydroxybutyrolactone dehydrogenase